MADADQREFGSTHGCNRIRVEHCAQCLRLCPEPGHLRAAVLQERNKSRRVRRHGLKVEGHFLLADARALEAVDIELQRFRPRKPRELVCRHPHPWRDVLEEIRHRAAAGLQEIAHAVIHILQDIGELFLLDPHRSGGRRPTLERLRVGIRHLGELANLIGGSHRRAGHRDNSTCQRSCGSGCRDLCPARKGRHAGIGLV